MVEIRKRHCWECLRRRLVCDFARPGCGRCADSGIDCPGYGETQPLRLRWLDPGKVSSRRPKSSSNRRKRGKVSSYRVGSDHCEDKNEESMKSLNEVLRFSDETQNMTVYSPHLKTNVDALVDSLNYFNSCMYPQLAESLRLGPNTNIYKLSPKSFRLGLTRPTHLQLGFICMTLSHRINQMEHDSDSTTLGKAFFRYRGLMIRSLNDDISIQDRRSDDVVLAGILTLMLADTQQGISQHWWYHIEGVRRLIILRGGVHRLVATSPGVLPIVLSFIYIVVTADTTSPASDMLIEGLDIDELYEIVKGYGGNGYGFQMCPAPLFAELIQINHVRSQIPKLNCGNEDELRTDAYEILRRIYHFSPDAWMALNECLTDERRLVINIYQSAVALYCMSSLHILLYLPSDSLLRKNSDMERRILRELLEKALRSRPRGYIFWPLVVLGVRSVDGGPALRGFVREKMIDLSAFFGTYSPLAAKEVLERFWASGKTNWDACFDEAHMFTTVLTVNRGQLSGRPS